jgi:transposase
MWYAGLDWADEHHDVVIIDEAARQVASKRAAHTTEGVDELISLLKSIAGAAFKEDLACIVETNRGLLITALLEAGLTVYPVNPKTIDRRRVASGAKTDRIDAYLLAKLGRSDLVDLRRLEPDSPTIQQLKALARDQDGLIQMQTGLVNQLTACLKAYYPVALQLFTKLQQRSTLLFLQAFPTPQAAQAATQDEIMAVLAQTGGALQSDQSGSPDRGNAAAASAGGGCDHDQHESALAAGVGWPTAAPARTDRRLRQGHRSPFF